MLSEPFPYRTVFLLRTARICAFNSVTFRKMFRNCLKLCSIRQPFRKRFRMAMAAHGNGAWHCHSPAYIYNCAKSFFDHNFIIPPISITKDAGTILKGAPRFIEHFFPVFFLRLYIFGFDLCGSIPNFLPSGSTSTGLYLIFPLRVRPSRAYTLFPPFGFDLHGSLPYFPLSGTNFAGLYLIFPLRVRPSRVYT